MIRAGALLGGDKDVPKTHWYILWKQKWRLRVIAFVNSVFKIFHTLFLPLQTVQISPIALNSFMFFFLV